MLFRSDFAQRKINERLKDVCISVQPEDYFSIDQPIINDVIVMKVSQDMCIHEIRNEIFNNKERMIYTKTQDEAPAFFTPTSDVRNSIISTGCQVEGTVENSIIFRNVNIGKGAVVRNSIIMMHVDIGAGAMLDNVIADKYVQISDRVKIQGDEDEPVIIYKDMKI